jgi:hypothetical protein
MGCDAKKNQQPRLKRQQALTLPKRIERDQPLRKNKEGESQEGQREI